MIDELYDAIDKLNARWADETCAAQLERDEARRLAVALGTIGAAKPENWRETIERYRTELTMSEREGAESRQDHGSKGNN